jgi:hypothetical protein
LDGRAAGCKPSKRTASPNLSQFGRKCDAGEKPPSRQLIPAMRPKLALATGGRRRVASERRVRRLQTREIRQPDSTCRVFFVPATTCVGRAITADSGSGFTTFCCLTCSWRSGFFSFLRVCQMLHGARNVEDLPALFPRLRHTRVVHTESARTLSCAGPRVGRLHLLSHWWSREDEERRESESGEILLCGESSSWE